MGIVTTIALVAVRSSLQVRRQMRQEVQLEQTRWLLDAGLARGTQQLREAADYQGETWQVTPALAGYPQATVKIEIIDDDSTPDDSRRLHVTAQLGPSAPSSAASVGSTRRSDSIIIPPLPSSSDNG
ncbi:hypothetical protein [Roseimaritima ulvae]|nr:hypothetical protein [Roseimaritima ulvae]